MGHILRGHPNAVFQTCSFPAPRRAVRINHQLPSISHRGGRRPMSASSDGKIRNAPVVMTVGAVLGVGLILAAAALLYWAEGKAISTAASLEQGKGDARTVAADKADPANDG